MGEFKMTLEARLGTTQNWMMT